MNAMGYFLGMICLLIVAWAIAYGIIKLRRNKAKKKVYQRTDAEKKRDLAATLEPYGFLYDTSQDYFYSGMYPWQRDFGYCRFYDEAAPSFHMVIDSEPIYFEYDNRRWLIEFWKGQYGMTVGAEVGIYVTDKEDVNIPGVFKGPFFECVADEERIQMSFVLKKGKDILMIRNDYHWWLTGFVIGEYTWPKKLTMEIRLAFPNINMRDAFIEGLKNAGYKSGRIFVRDNMVGVIFDKPKAKQKFIYDKWAIYMVQWMNRYNCRKYKKVTKEFTRNLDKLDYLRFCFPRLFKAAVSITRVEGLQKAYQVIKSFFDRED